MKKIILSIIFLTTFCFAQRFELRETWTAKDTNNVVYEVGVDIKDSQTGQSFRYGLPNNLWQSTDSIKVQWALGQIFDAYAFADSVKTANAKAVLKEPTVTKTKKNKKYDKQ